MHIAIAGNIGSGKTTLTKMLAAHYGWVPKFESVDYNPYLTDFYNDMERWSFNIQIYFLNKRFKDVLDISQSSDFIVQDRTIFEDARIFAPNLHEMGLMSSRDFECYGELFDQMMSLVKAPDLLIYLRSSIPNLIAQIQKRGREFEKNIRIDYLKGLNQRYEEWIESYPDRLLVIDVDECRFEDKAEDFARLCAQIEENIKTR
ncbi:MAG: deoxynucleoside kinase [Bacteroidales bacterium]|jgi:deoxyadenosine/deoxycytidine kinase|nr:deoxynucleoside kinase [Bacteroidales bacterium]